MTEVASEIHTSIEPETASPKPNLSGGRPPIGSIRSRPRPRPYKDVTIIKTINKAKFPVYLAGTKGSDQKYALKMFPEEEGQPHTYFKNEIRFTALNHPNIIKNFHVEQGKEISYKGDMVTVSYLLMEYAPFGDFFDLVTIYRDHLSDKLIRTYFRQLIEGLEYIHSKEAAHLDLKLENLLLGDNFSLKIADFDLSYFSGDKKILTKGTKFYRAPELMNSKCENCFAADVYSAGVILFVFKSGGVIPHSETSLFKGIDLFDLLNNNNSEFWKKHCEIQSRGHSYFSADFRELFNGMTKLLPEERLTLEEVKASKWYNGPVYTDEELKSYVETFIRI